MLKIIRETAASTGFPEIWRFIGIRTCMMLVYVTAVVFLGDVQ